MEVVWLPEQRWIHFGSGFRVTDISLIMMTAFWSSGWSVSCLMVRCATVPGTVLYCTCIVL